MGPRAECREGAAPPGPSTLPMPSRPPSLPRDPTCPPSPAWLGRKPCLWAARLDCERKPVLGLALALTLTLTLTRRAPSTLCCGCEAARRSRRVRHMRAFLLGAECGFVVCGSCSTG